MALLFIQKCLKIPQSIFNSFPKAIAFLFMQKCLKIAQSVAQSIFNSSQGYGLAFLYKNALKLLNQCSTLSQRP